MIFEPKKSTKGSAEATLYSDFEQRVEIFVKKKLEGYCPSTLFKNKVIHDPVWGTMLFYPWELQILDSPLLQRLRNINQVGLAILTYPAARHSRFEHTLGVMTVVSKMVDNINHTAEKSDESGTRTITDTDLFKLRLAALLHDVGHCFFSHLSESIYGSLNPFDKLKNSFEIFEAAKEHEIFGYVIVNSPSFTEFFHNKIDYNPNIKEINKTKKIDETKKFLSDIGKMIVGAFLDYETIGKKKERKYYLTQIINGQFDADKLDYLRRDSYTAGLALTYDIERLLYKIRIVENDEKKEGSIVPKFGKHLTIPITGISAIEEMVFSQLMLTSYIYQHQKVLAADALISDVVKGLTINKKLTHPCDFLNYCDDDIYRIYTDSSDNDFRAAISNDRITSDSSKTLADIVKKVKNRDLPKRALIINFNNVENMINSEGKSLGKTKYRVSELFNHLKEISEVRQEICDEARKISDKVDKDDGGKKQIDYYDIHIVIPKTNIAKDLSNAFVLSNEDKLIKMSEVVRLDDWGDAFSFHKWNAYVFAYADIVPIVSIASKIVFERHGILFKEEIFKCLKQCKEIEKLCQILKDKHDYFSENKA